VGFLAAFDCLLKVASLQKPVEPDAQARRLPKTSPARAARIFSKQRNRQ